jgi:hypothetical protein
MCRRYRIGNMVGAKIGSRTGAVDEHKKKIQKHG